MVKTEGAVLLFRACAGKQQQVAELLGYNQATVNRWASGLRVPKSDSREKMLAVLGIPVDAWERGPQEERAPDLGEVGETNVDAEARLLVERVRAIRVAATSDTSLPPEEELSRLEKAGRILAHVGMITGETLDIPESKVVKLPAFRKLVRRLIVVLTGVPGAAEALRAEIDEREE